MAGEEAREVRAEVIDTPTIMPGVDRWLAKQREKVDGISKEYVPHAITSADDYKSSKRARTSARKEIKAVEDERRAKLGAIKDAVASIEGEVRDLLTPLKDIDSEYKAALDEWERLAVESRTQSVAAWYAEGFGDVAALVTWDTLWARYSEAGKWGLYGTNEVAIEQGVEEAVKGIQADLDTIARSPFDDADRKTVMAEYLRTLDLSAALRDAEAARQRRERMARVERERREREEMARAEEERERQRREQAAREERERAEAERQATLQAAEEARQRRVAEGMEAPAVADAETEAWVDGRIEEMRSEAEVEPTYLIDIPAQTVTGLSYQQAVECGQWFRARGIHGSIKKEA